MHVHLGRFSSRQGRTRRCEGEEGEALLGISRVDHDDCPVKHAIVPDPSRSVARLRNDPSVSVDTGRFGPGTDITA